MIAVFASLGFACVIVILWVQALDRADRLHRDCGCWTSDTHEPRLELPRARALHREKQSDLRASRWS